MKANDEKLHFYKINTAIATLYCYGKEYKNPNPEFKEIFTGSKLTITEEGVRTIFKDTSLILPSNDGEYLVSPLDEDQFLNEMDVEIEKAGSIENKTAEMFNLFNTIYKEKQAELETSMLKK